MSSIRQVEPRDLRRALEAGEPLVLVDVREPHELELASLPGAVHIPLGRFAARAEQVLDPNARIVVLCHHGVRSMAAAGFLVERGFEQVHNLLGGIDRYSVEADPDVPRY